MSKGQQMGDNFPSIITEDEYPAAIASIEAKFAHDMKHGIHVTPQGIHLSYAYMTVEHPIANLIFLHGYTEFYQKYYEAASYFLSLGYNVFLYDHRGHGYSEREVSDSALAHIDDYEDYVDDLESIINDLVIKVAPDLPLEFFAHSLGGTIAILYMQRHPNRIHKAVLASPMIIPQTHHIPRFVVRHKAAVGVARQGARGRFQYANDFNPNPDYTKSHDTSFARFEHNLNIRREDIHYQNSATTNGWLLQSVSIDKKLLNRKKNACIQTQIAVCSAGRDTVVRVGPQKRFAHQIKGCEYMVFPEARHSIYSAGDAYLPDFYQRIFRFLQLNEV